MSAPAPYLEKRVVGEVLVLSFPANFSLDHKSLAAVRDELAYWQQDHRLIALGLRHLGYLNSAGIGMLIQAYKRALSAKGRLVLFAAPEKIRQLLRITKVEKIIPLYDDADLAIDALSDPA